MENYALFKLFHLLLFVYWLGGDLGTYYASRFVVRDDLAPEQRATALKIMAGCDQAPRICMTLIFAAGLHMTWLNGMIVVNGTVVALVWLISLVWLAMVLAIHFMGDRPIIEKLTRVDFIFRLLVISATALTGVYGLAGGGAIKPDWIAVKFLLFAALVACGLFIRVYLRPFAPAFARLLAEGPSAEVNLVISASLARCRPFVYLIWIGLLIAAALSLRLIRI